MSLDAENISGQGGGPNLVRRNAFAPSYGADVSLRTIDRPAVSTADYYHVGGGIYWAQPYDLNAMGAWGQAIASAKGMRYVWILAADHNGQNTWGIDSNGIYSAFSNDPAVLPDPSTMTAIVPSGDTFVPVPHPTWAVGTTYGLASFVTGSNSLIYRSIVHGNLGNDPTTDGGAHWISGGTANFNGFIFPSLVYNPDDVTHRAYLYLQAVDASGGPNTNAWNEGLWINDNFDTPFTFTCISHSNILGLGFGFTSGQSVFRLGTGNWVSIGGSDVGGNNGTVGKWTSTDGKEFTYLGLANQKIGTRTFFAESATLFTVGGQQYAVTREDDRGSPWAAGTTYALGDIATLAVTPPTFGFQSYRSLANGNVGNNPATSPASWALYNGGMYVTQAAIDSSMNILSSPAPTRISDRYNGVFPGPTYVSHVTGYYEDGILYSYATNGFFNSIAPLAATLSFAAGGGLQQEYCSIYPVIMDTTAAVNAAPPGVVASCAGGNVLLRWYDILPGHAYRIYRGTSAGSITTNLGDVSNQAQFLDTGATLGSVYYYKVVALNGGIEKGSRTVSTWVGPYGPLVNKHITRALAAGADATTIDEAWLGRVDRWLIANNLQNRLMFWTSARFGVAKSGSTISRIFDLGTSRMPRGGDFTPTTSATTYGSTAVNSASPGWVNANSNSFGYFGGYGRGTSVQGRLNQIRLWDGVTFVAAYQKSNATQTTLLSISEFGGLTLQNTAGSPGSASFVVGNNSNLPNWTITATDPSALAGVTPHIIAGTFDGTTATVWAEGVAKNTATTANTNTPLIGQNNQSGTSPQLFLGSGSTNLKFNPNAASVGGTYSFENNEAQFTGSDLVVFDRVLSAVEMASLTALLRSGTTAPTVKNIDAHYSAVGNGKIVTTSISVSISPNTLFVPSGPFLIGDVGKKIAVSGCGPANTPIAGYNTLFTTIAGFADAQHVTLTAAPSNTLSGSTQTVEWGTDDSAAFAAFNAALAGSTTPVQLNLTPGKRYCLASGGIGVGFGFNIKDLRAVGSLSNPAVISDMLGVGSGAFLGGCISAQFNDNVHQARTATVQAGATVIPLVTPSDASLFTVGRPALMTGLDTQDDNQFPTNQYYYEPVVPTAIHIGTTGPSGSDPSTVTIQSPLKNTYKSTWPYYGYHGGVDNGGPATLYALNAGYDCEHEYYGLGSEQFLLVNSLGRDITITGGYTHGLGLYPSTNANWTANAVDASFAGNPGQPFNSGEFDKLNGNVTLNGGTWRNLNFQSSSPDLFTMNNVHVTNSMQGGGKNNVLIGCLIDATGVTFVPHSYGVGTSIYCESCTFADIGIGGLTENDILGAGAYVFSGNTIRRPKIAGSGHPPQWAIPGTELFIGGRWLTETCFQIVDIGEDGSNIIITTSLAGFPGVPASVGGAYTIRTHPGAQSTFVSCSGCPDVVDFTGNPTAKAPLYSYSKRTFADWTLQQQPSANVWGRLVSLKIIGNTAYTGVRGTLVLEPVGQFGTDIITPSGVAAQYDPLVNTLVPGERDILPTSATGLSGDTLGSAPGVCWFASNIGPFLDNSIAGESSTVWPSFTVELITDQSVIFGILLPNLNNRAGVCIDF